MLCYGSDPALPEFYQYLCGTGQFDLADINPKLWKELLNKNSIELPPGMNAIQSNEGLATIVDGIKHRIQQKALRDIPAVEPREVPNDFVLRLAILGRAFSGKKTVAKQIQDQYGGPQNVKIWNMDDIIIEAIEYVTPKKVDEVAAAEASKKAPARKGKQEEIVPVDIFEGRDTTEYKRIANSIKQMYFPEFEGEWVTKIDLSNLIVDDAVLIELFAERLRLEYQGKVVPKKDLKQGCVRELEILKQLEEIELQQ